MSEPVQDVQPAAEQTIQQVVEPAAPAPAVAAQPAFPPLPRYALHYAPILWLNDKEKYWPGTVLEHLDNCIPQNKNGTDINIPQELTGRIEILALPDVNKDDVFLCLKDADDPRVNDRIEALMSTRGKPDPTAHRSSAPVWIITVDKSKHVEEGVLDVFYFYFYPYNLGNTVAFTEFGNHVGDWEHSMVRFKHGKPIALHLSAHADGHSYPWHLPEKMGDRPVGYVATGSHAMYATPGVKDYSPVKLVGPKDYAARGVLWDPTLNYVAASYDIDSQTFSPVGPPAPTPTETAAAPQPGAEPYLNPEGSLHNNPNVQPTYDTSLTPEQIITVLNYKGRWGNSFSDVRSSKGQSKFDQMFGELFHKDKGHDTFGLRQRLAMLRWAEGPSGPRWKSLERQGVTWNTTALLNQLV